jgi:Coenzyme PQQ synthesis protein D (PqqD)
MEFSRVKEQANEKYVSRGGNLGARMLGGEMMIMSVTDSTLLSLNPVASAIWQAADGRTPLREIVEREIVPQFEIDAETAYRDALEFAEALAAYGILKITEGPAEGTGGDNDNGKSVAREKYGRQL